MQSLSKVGNSTDSKDHLSKQCVLGLGQSNRLYNRTSSSHAKTEEDIWDWESAPASHTVSKKESSKGECVV